MTDLRLDIARDLSGIEDMYARLRSEAINRAGDPDIPGGAAMVLLGPGADVEAWGYIQLSSIFGRLSIDKEEQDRIERDGIEPPLSFLASWADIVREERGQEPSNRRARIGDEIRYLRSAIDWMISVDDDGEPWWLPVDDFATRLHQVRVVLESVLGEGFRPESGAPCLHCHADLEREHSEYRGFLDSYRCGRCGRRYDRNSYLLAVGATYLAHSPTLTAAQIEQREQIPATKVRVWGARYEGLKAGRTPEGLFLYDVAAVLKKRDELAKEAA